MKQPTGSISNPAQLRRDHPLQMGAVVSAAGVAPVANDVASTLSQAEQEIQIANAHYGRGEFPAALNHYAAAVRLAPQVAAYHFRLGCCAWDVGSRDQA